MRREKTGYYDRTGKAICDGDRVKAIIGGQIYKGYVDLLFGHDWVLKVTSEHDNLWDWRPYLFEADDIEILEGD